MVEIGEQQSETLVLALGQAHRLLQAIEEQGAIRQAGQAVGGGLPGQLVLRAAQLAEVGLYQHVADPLAVPVMAYVDAGPEDELTAVDGAIAEFARPLPMLAYLVPDLAIGKPVIRLGVQQVQRPLLECRARITGQALERRVHTLDQACHVSDQDGLAAV